MAWGMMDGFCGGGGFGWFGGIFNIVFWILLAWLVFTLIARSRYKREDMEKSEEDAMVILKRRYAKGEISKKEYEEMKKELK